MNKAVANTSIAHTVGNVTSLFTEFIKSLFPDNYFRHTHVNTRMAYREQKREENSKYEFIKKNKPILIIRPTIDLNNTDIFMTHSLFTTNLFGRDFQGGTPNFMPFYLDREAGCQLKYLLNRIRVNFEVTLMFDTEFEQINQFTYLKNMLIEERVYRMDTALEVLIPSDMVELISAYSNIPIKENESGTVKEFLDYMMSHSNKYVTFKERTSSSTREFFMYYPLSIDYVMTDLSRDSVSKKGWASDTCSINFNITTEFNTAALYEFVTLRPDQVARPVFDINLSGSRSIGDGINIIPQFTIGNLFDKTKLDNGFELFYSQVFATEPELQGMDDILDISGIFDRTSTKDIVAWHEKNGIPNTVFLQFIIMGNNKKLEEGIDYEIDLNTFKITIHNSDADITYRMSIFLNNLYVNNLYENYNNLSSCYEQQVGRVTDKTINLKKDNEIGIR